MLLSYNKPAVASTSQNDVNCNACTPAKAFDYDPATRWATSSTTGWVDPGWIYVDLGATANISRVVLQWDPAYATAYQIQVSANASTWTTIYSTTTGRGFKETINATGTGRYVRMYGTARATPYGYSLWEFQVYGTGGSPVHAAGAAERDRSRPPGWSSATSSTARPAPGRTRPSGSPTPARA